MRPAEAGRLLALVVAAAVCVTASSAAAAAAAGLVDETGRLLLKSGWDAEDCTCSANHFDYDGAWSHDVNGRQCVRQGGGLRSWELDTHKHTHTHNTHTRAHSLSRYLSVSLSLSLSHTHNPHTRLVSLPPYQLVSLPPYQPCECG
jgi:hypothetical protein